MGTFFRTIPEYMQREEEARKEKKRKEGETEYARTPPVALLDGTNLERYASAPLRSTSCGQCSFVSLHKYFGVFLT